LTFKALLLAAGLGTRLKPLTNDIPKCLVRLGNEPILGIWLKNLSKAGCESVLINTHYLSNQVEDYLKKKDFGNMQIITSYEPKLLGTAGTLIKNANFFLGGNSMFIHADNFTKTNLQAFMHFHVKNTVPKKKLLTMMTFKTDNPKSCGIVKVNNEGIVEKFYEKEDGENGEIANAAVYCFDDNLIKYLLSENKKFYDFSTDVIPNILGKIQTYHTNSTFIDIGTLESLKKARNELKKLIS
tara:strand:+ start:133 stop:855 length:723 start_codon:yes stop_codon:yes gene_type:complete